VPTISPVSAAVPVSAAAREGAAQSTPRARTAPPPFPAEDQVVMLALAHAFLSGTSRFHFSIPLRGPGLRTACRRRALEPYGKLSQLLGAWAWGWASNPNCHLGNLPYPPRYVYLTSGATLS
jgi:hypothetical protein